MEKENIKENEGIKLCSKCGVNPREEGQGYCSECRKEYNKQYYNDNKEYFEEYRENQRGNYIYVFKPIDKDYEGQLYYIGSTTLLECRMSRHLTLTTKASKRIFKDKRNFKPYYVEVDKDLNREELYFMEYFLIHTYNAMYEEKPKYNIIGEMNVDIEKQRQVELMLMALNLEFKEYDVSKHIKNAFQESES